MKTRDRIIHSALALFNEQGEPNVTTNHIAADLGISPGNLYYHFRNKEEIIHSIFDQYARDLSMGFQPEVPAESDEQRLLAYLDATFQLMWRYRFFYANLPDILSRDAELQQKYLAAQQALKANLFTMLSRFRDTGWLDMDNKELESLCSTLKLVASSWIFYQSAQAPAAKVTPLVIYQGVLQILNMVSPMTTEKGRAVVAELVSHYRTRMESSQTISGQA
ncbi:TetR/AcrR family transcriptional regulator [Enterovibrio paralichthyis]|uniref:TetR/AcrR family transcriptional regulator n=1 Tax=Enterovibrio paralichthyis TaxID=2853805 RepID=UPI0006CF80C2|nr:TetR/AcrR family transcriptional regulator [Enterovibrio paralichthyis]MBV7298742.1 TetR/AcrR family transcriptional regulator [Enterovibrio paralichthyis]